jgi:tetratricopeptide (TPR) repeat protein
MIKRVCILLLLAVSGTDLFISCQAEKSGKAPGWIKTGQADNYPSSQYLVGIGSAKDTGHPDEDRAAADDSARVNLASQIRVKVDAELRTRVEEQTRYGSGGGASLGRQDVESLIRSSVDIELVGVEFAQRHHDPAKKVYYTLAVLDRSRAAASLRQEVSRLREEGRHYYEEAEALSDRGELRDALRSLNHSLEILAEAEGKETVISVMEGRPLSAGPDELSPWQVGARRDEIRGKLRYLIKIYESNPFLDDSAFVASALVSRLNEISLDAVHAGDTFSELSYDELLRAPSEYYAEQIGDRAYYLIVGKAEAKLSSQTMIGKNDFFFYKSRAEVNMINVRTGKVLFTVSFDWEERTKAGKSRKDQAAALSLEQAGELIARMLVDEIEGYLGMSGSGGSGGSY